MFFTYHQNNSGGHFHEDPEKGIGAFVIIEAKNASAAEDKALDIGLYFNGVEEGQDCECCGDRWYGSSDEAEVPSIYGKNVLETGYGSYFGHDSYIHYLDGKIEKVKDKEPSGE